MHWTPLEDHSRISLIDHIMIENNDISCINNTVILDEDGNPSDHMPVLCEFKFDISTSSHNKVNKHYIKWKKFSSEDIHNLYTLKLKDLLGSLPTVPYYLQTRESVAIHYNFSGSKHEVMCLTKHWGDRFPVNT